MQSQAAYDSLKAAKQAEIKAGQEQRDTKLQELADTDAKNAQAKEDLEDTRNTLSAAEKVLFAAAKKFGNPKIAALATRVRLDAFEKVTEQIDGMVTALKKEKADDIKMKDFCVEAINENERAQELKQRDIEGLDAKIADLTALIDQLAKEISALKAEIA